MMYDERYLERNLVRHPPGLFISAHRSPHQLLI